VSRPIPCFHTPPCIPKNSVFSEIGRPCNCTLARSGRIDRSNQGDLRNVLRSETPTRLLERRRNYHSSIGTRERTNKPGGGSRPRCKVVDSFRGFHEIFTIALSRPFAHLMFLSLSSFQMDFCSNTRRQQMLARPDVSQLLSVAVSARVEGENVLLKHPLKQPTASLENRPDDRRTSGRAAWQRSSGLVVRRRVESPIVTVAGKKTRRLTRLDTHDRKLSRTRSRRS